MQPCACPGPHVPRTIVLTGGPGAGKTAVLELMRRTLCAHVRIVPESAGVVFGGGFPRDAGAPAQRAIFYVQRELEAALGGGDVAIALCDRGTVDGSAYWPGPGELWEAVGTTLDAQLARYDAVIHLRTPPADGGYNRQNPLRVEDAAQAVAIDERIARAWARHPRRYEVACEPDFLAKATRAIELIRGELPPCCRGHADAERGEPWERAGRG
jgi:predicted ATPase